MKASPSGRRPSADDLLVLLAVGRSGRYVVAAEELGINHTTISRRIAALEQSMGGRVLARVAGGWELTESASMLQSGVLLKEIDGGHRRPVVRHGEQDRAAGVVGVQVEPLVGEQLEQALELERVLE